MMVEWIIALLVAIALSLGAGAGQAVGETRTSAEAVTVARVADGAITTATIGAAAVSASTIATSADYPDCWEDEVVVQVVWDPYESSPGVGTYGCVAADNLPVTGTRPPYPDAP